MVRHGTRSFVPFFALLAALLVSRLPAQKVEWWQKDLDSALTASKDCKAAMVLLYLWRDPDDNCSAMFGGTFADEKVVPVMVEFLCMGAKESDEAGQKLFQKFGIERAPTVLFLSPDGTIVDAVPGYVPVAEFLAEIARIKKGERTVASLRTAAAAKPADFELQMELVRKLRATGDKKGSLAVIDAILAKDPKAANEFAAEAMLLKINDEVFKPEIAPADYDLEPLRAFLAKQKNKRILFLGYDRMAAAEFRRQNLKAAAAFAERAWKSIPADQVQSWGQSIAGKAYQNWKELDKIDKGILKLALTVSEKALKEIEKEQTKTPDNPFYANALYLHAAVMLVNNKRKEAFAMMDKAMGIDPKNENLKKAKDAWVDGAK